MEAWLGLLGALSGTAIGGFVTYKVANQQHAHERRSERERRLIEAYESMHLILSKFSGQAHRLNMGVIGALGLNLPLKGDEIKDEIQLDRLRMLVDLYAPALAPSIAAITDQFTIIARAAAEAVMKQQPSDEWRASTTEKSVAAALEVARLAQEAQLQVAALARSGLAR